MTESGLTGTSGPPTILVTGSTDGLGKQTALDLARRGAAVLVHGRDAGKTEATLNEIRSETGNDRLRAYMADFAELAAVRRLADEVDRENGQLDVLVNNAGIGGGKEGDGREESRDGYELRFAVNYLSPYLLTRLLLPLLRRSAPARVVNVASIGQAPIDFDDVMLERGYTGSRAYGQSKLAQIMFTFELSELLRAEGEERLTVNVLHPASLMNTKMVYESYGYTLSTIEDGVEATLRLAVSPELEEVSGRFFNELREDRANEQAYDPDARRRLWQLSEELVGLPAFGLGA
jgi:NAD(P)-dependent dehydrogenase (short-subunit alcohol dehydrogenase family)